MICRVLFYRQMAAGRRWLLSVVLTACELTAMPKITVILSTSGSVAAFKNPAKIFEKSRSIFSEYYLFRWSQALLPRCGNSTKIYHNYRDMQSSLPLETTWIHDLENGKMKLCRTHHNNTALPALKMSNSACFLERVIWSNAADPIINILVCLWKVSSDQC